MPDYHYTPPTVTVDGIIFQIVEGQLAVLLIQRARDPFKGVWALPGGYNPAGETTLQALDRILVDKAGVRTDHLGVTEQLYTFDSIARDPRGHAVSITYMGLGRDITPSEHGKQGPRFFPVRDLPKLAYDHDKIIRYAQERLRAKLSYSNIAFALLSKFFTLTQLQMVYEAVLGHSLDKRNFRKRILSFDLVQETEEMSHDGAHRPARLYKFRDHQSQTFVHNLG